MFLGVLLLAFGCTRDSGDGGLPVDDRVLRRGNGGDPGTLDPAQATDVHAFNILVDLYEGLITEAADGDLIPGVAESWHISDDGLVYTFMLRDDARWSDGSRVVASDFVTSLQRAVAPGIAAPYGFLLEPLAGFDAIQSGEAPPEALGVVAATADTLQMTLSKPTAQWLSVLALPVAYPVKSASDGTVLTNGPYKLLERQAHGVVRLEKNGYYWSADTVAIDKVEYHAIVNPVAELDRYRAGELDITHIIPSEHVASLRAERPDEVRIAPFLALYYLAFDLTEPPLDNRSLRAALSIAVDRETLVALTGRGERPAYGVVPPNMSGYDNASHGWQDHTRTERVDKARRFYADAGYGPDRPLELQLAYDVGDIHEKVALAVASMWQDVLGVQVNLEKMEWKLFLDTRDNRPAWQVMRFAWTGDYNSPATFLDIFRSDSLQNLSGYRSERYDELLDEAAGQTVPAASASLMQAAEQHLLEDYPIAPLYFFVSKHLVRPGISGFEDNVLDRHPSRFLDLPDPDL